MSVLKKGRSSLLPLAQWGRRIARHRKRAARRPAVRRLCAETLEDRTLLSAQGVGSLGDFASLVVDPGDYDSGGILVRFHPQADCQTALLCQFNSHAVFPGTSLGRGFDLVSGLYEVRLPANASVQAALSAFADDPLVAYAEPNYRLSIAATPNDPRFDELWGLHNAGQTGGTAGADINAPQAWDLTTGSTSTVVAVIDTGVDYKHPDLADNMWINVAEANGRKNQDDDGNGYVDDIYGYDFANDDSDPMDDHNHGTHVAGTIGAVGNNGKGITGINWNVRIMALKFLDENGSGTTADAIDAVNYAASMGAHISNNSWGGGPFSQALYDAIESARQAGHIFMAAAGNGNFLGIGQDNDASPFYPASFDLDNIISVAATDHNDAKAVFSNFGATSVDIGAPGVDILSTTRNRTYSVFSGTSMATPHVAGVVALVRDLHPEWPYYQVIDKVVSSADPIAALQGVTVTGGRLDAAAALEPDLTGPQILGTDLFGFVSGPVNRLRLVFNEALDAASFSADDISDFTGPAGAIAVTAVSPVPDTRGREFEVTFPSQSGLGDYSITVGPNITDLAGNLLDQDGDGINGEAVDDRFGAGFTLVPFAARFDFGTPSSPAQIGYTRVSPFDSYDSAVGYGWAPGTVLAVDRGTGTALTRDLNYYRELTFSVDLPDGGYHVVVTIGDTAWPHDQMALSLEGALLETVNTAAGEVLSRTYNGVTVADGRLTLQLEDLGGSDENVVINALEIVSAAPRVIAATPRAAVMGPVDRVTLTFSEPIQDGSFTVDDVTALAGPVGTVAPSAVNKLSETLYEIVFPAQDVEGGYSLSVGPQITDVDGFAMDQDADGTAGEPDEDRFTVDFTIVPFVARYDFGEAGSPVADDFIAVVPNDVYDSFSGYGWIGGGTVLAVDRGVGTELTRDLNYHHNLSFAVDVPNATYDVSVTIGDTGWFHDQIGVFLEGAQVGTVSTASGEVLTITYSDISVPDGQLSLDLNDLGGSDVNVVINALEVIWSGPDRVGPRVIDVEPKNAVAAPVDRVTLTFSEAVLDGSFTTDDVASLAGPAGTIAPGAVNKLSHTQYEVVFDPQQAGGQYSLIIGPDILDVDGNSMDQDQDGTNGEAIQDRFSSSFTIVPVAARFDFGTSNSPVEPGYTHVDPSDVYNSVTGYGWLGGGTVLSVDRGTGTALTRDLNYYRQLSFGVDVPSATYDITLTIGDTGWFHDQMGVFIQGVQWDTVSTTSGQVMTVTYEGIAVSDGQLTFDLDDLGGSDENVVINALEVVWSGPDRVGPRVVSATPDGTVSGPVDRFTLLFNEPILDGSFSLSDVVTLSGPAGTITPTSVDKLSDTQYEVVFPAQQESGNYNLTVGPDILDLDGNPLDQDEDGTAGEAVQDRFTKGFTLVPFAAKFDFGTDSSPAEPGYVQVVPTMAYSATLGYGWQPGTVLSVDRGSGTALTRDLNYFREVTFSLDLPNGTYDVTVMIGDTGWAHDLMGVSLEGVQVDTLSTAAGQVATVIYAGIKVNDGQLTLRLEDLGGSDENVVINALEVIWVGPDTIGPRGVGAAPVDGTTGPVDRVTITFDEPIQDGSFTTDDVVSLNGPSGAIAVAGVNKLSAKQYEVTFASQSTAGDYSLKIGPDILDAAGNAMDQDRDGVNGESVQDRFSTAFTIEPFAARFDFGTTASPVEAGYTRITPSDTYSATVGYGWIGGGTVLAVDRGNGTPLSRDLNYYRQLSFGVDVPGGIYDVTLSLGDTGWFHDEIGVFLEGAQVDTVSTASGEVITVTYASIAVSDGQLTLVLDDLGGLDENVVINTLQVASSSASSLSAVHPVIESNRPTWGDIETRIDRRVGRPNEPVAQPLSVRATDGAKHDVAAALPTARTTVPRLTLPDAELVDRVVLDYVLNEPEEFRWILQARWLP